jgi:hypothetical protein
MIMLCAVYSVGMIRARAAYRRGRCLRRRTQIVLSPICETEGEVTRKGHACHSADHIM